MPPTLSVIIPVYNEQKTLPEIVRRVQSIALAKEIILVDDGSHDGTQDALESLRGTDGIRVFCHEQNQGKGAAIRTGMRHAAGDIVLLQDADLEYDPADVPNLIQPILNGAADVVLGSRFLGAPEWQSWLHSFGNRFLTLLSNCFTRLGLTDMETGYKAFRRNVVEEIGPKLRENRFGIEPELMARIARHRYRVAEVPIRYTARSHAQGKKIGWRDALRAVWCIVRY